MPDTSNSSISALVAISNREVGDDLVQTADARQLHGFLENRDAFANWIADRIRQYDFVEGVDFATYLANSKKGRPSKEYAVSLDMAKELAMVERNDRGKQARRYFIECERRVHQISAARKVPRPDVSKETRLAMAQHLRLAKMAGLSGNQALLAANKATAAMTGIDSLALMGITHVTAPKNEALLTPTTIAQRAGAKSGQAVNNILCELGLQQRFFDHKGHVYYEPTEMGEKAGGTMLDTGKKHSTGAPVRQLKWASSIVHVIDDAIQQKQAA